MNSRLSVVLALSAGLAGGLLTRYIAPAPVFAQDQASVAKEIRAQSFSLVDQSNRVVGTFLFEAANGFAGRDRNGPFPVPGRIVLRDGRGLVIWSAGGIGLQPLGLK